MSEVTIPVEQLLQQPLDDGSACAASEPFALQVTDDSMEPEFAQGCIIIIDRSGVLRDGCFVLATDQQGDYIFRQLHFSNQSYMLHPLNPAYKSLAVSREHIEGVIIQRAGKRRAYHKRYE